MTRKYKKRNCVKLSYNSNQKPGKMKSRVLMALTAN